MEKQNWKTPVIEEIELKFDKQMDAVCYKSNSTPEFDTNCGVQEGASWNCWNKKTDPK